MQHNPDFTLAHPVMPLADCPEHVRKALGYKEPKRASVTRDGRLACRCADPAGCTCKAVTADAQAPGKPRISQAAAPAEQLVCIGHEAAAGGRDEMLIAARSLL
jgi:hypothetical protein